MALEILVVQRWIKQTQELVDRNDQHQEIHLRNLAYFKQELLNLKD